MKSPISSAVDAGAGMATELLPAPRRRPLAAFMTTRTNLTKGETDMMKVLAALLLVASFLFVAPVIESGTSGSTQMFQAIGTADGGGGGD
jgi:hypothetical protein